MMPAQGRKLEEKAEDHRIKKGLDCSNKIYFESSRLNKCIEVLTHQQISPVTTIVIYQQSLFNIYWESTNPVTHSASLKNPEDLKGYDRTMQPASQ